MTAGKAAGMGKPNVVQVDDMGYGDFGVFSKGVKDASPHPPDSD